MSTSRLGLQRSLPILSAAMGLLALSGGIYSIIDPRAFSDGLGFPVPAHTSPAIQLASIAGARNLGSGITILAFLYTGQKRAAATCLMCGVVTPMLDSWICFQYDGWDGKAVGHAVMGVLVGLLGAGLYWV